MGMKLTEIGKGKSGVVLEVESKELAVSLMKHGLMAGDSITVTDLAPFGGPIAVQVNGHKVALRRRDALMITVKPLA